MTRQQFEGLARDCAKPNASAYVESEVSIQNVMHIATLHHHHTHNHTQSFTAGIPVLYSAAEKGGSDYKTTEDHTDILY